MAPKPVVTFSTRWKTVEQKLLLQGVRPVPHDMRRGPITCRFGTVSRSEIKVISRRELQSTVLTEVVVCIGAPLCT